MNMHKNARLTPQGRLLLVRRVIEQGWTVVSAASAAGLSERQAYRWLARYRSGEPLADNQDLLDRVGCLLGIHKVLRIMFPHNRDLVYRWMTAPNRRLSKRPVDVVLEHGFEGLLAVRRYLETERGR